MRQGVASQTLRPPKVSKFMIMPSMSCYNLAPLLYSPWHLVFSALSGGVTLRKPQLKGPKNFGFNCWFNASCQGLGNCPTVIKAVRSIRPRREDEPINVVDAFVEGIQRVLCLRTSASYALSTRDWRDLAETVLPGREQQDPADAFEQATFLKHGPGNVFSDVIFPPHLEAEIRTVVTPHNSTCKEHDSADFQGRVRVSRVLTSSGAIFTVDQDFFDAACRSHSAGAPLHDDSDASYFQDAVPDLSDDDSVIDNSAGGGAGSSSRGKPSSSLLLRCINTLLNPPVVYEEADYKLFEGVRVPKDCCKNCRVRAKFSTSRRLVTLSNLVVFQIQRSRAAVDIPAPREIVLRNWGRIGDSKPPRTYALRAVIHRRGDVAGRAGHWWANLRQTDGWLRCDDTDVRQVKSAGDAATASLFLYEDATVTCNDDDDGGAEVAGDGEISDSHDISEADEGCGVDRESDGAADKLKVVETSGG